MFKICKDHILFELFLWRKKRKRKNKIEILCLVLFNLLKVSGTFRVDLALEQQREVSCKLLSSSVSFFQELPLYLMCRWPF